MILKMYPEKSGMFFESEEDMLIYYDPVTREKN